MLFTSSSASLAGKAAVVRAQRQAERDGPCARRDAHAAVNVEQLDLLQKALRAAANAVLQRAYGDTLGAHHGDIACNSGELRQRPVDGDTVPHRVERIKAQLGGVDLRVHAVGGRDERVDLT